MDATYNLSGGFKPTIKRFASATIRSSSHPRKNGDVASVSHPAILQAANTAGASSVAMLQGRIAYRNGLLLRLYSMIAGSEIQSPSDRT